MKKTFKLTAPNKAPDRQADWVKHEIKKYIGRERRKALPENVDFWDFDCKFGNNPETAEVIHISEINKKIAASASAKKETFYIEVLAKPGYRNKTS
jgi:hypothetical protein